MLQFQSALKRILLRYIGIQSGVLKKHEERIRYVSGVHTISEGIWLVPHRRADYSSIALRNDLYTMIEVLLFAVTRHLVIQHVHTWEALIGVAAIAILFATRKFLFMHPESYEQMKRRREHLD